LCQLYGFRLKRRRLSVELWQR